MTSRFVCVCGGVWCVCVCWHLVCCTLRVHHSRFVCVQPPGGWESHHRGTSCVHVLSIKVRCLFCEVSTGSGWLPRYLLCAVCQRYATRLCMRHTPNCTQRHTSTNTIMAPLNVSESDNTNRVRTCCEQLQCSCCTDAMRRHTQMHIHA